MALDAAMLAAREAGVGYYADAVRRVSAEKDFGALAKGSCLLVAEPNSPEACQKLIGALRQRNLGCTLRGAGYSQSGQSVAVDTVTLSTRRLDWVGNVDCEQRSIVVGAGASPRQLVCSTLDAGLVPPVLPLNLDMSIGGLLSAGGLGPTSHRHGPVAANVLGLDVVTGAGELRRCSRQQDPDLFDAVLSGMGQFGLITSATFALVPAPRRMRVYSFLYASVEEWLADQITASDAKLGARLELEGFCWGAAKGLRSTPTGPVPVTHWMYGLQIAVDDEVASSAGVANLLSSLRPMRKLDEYATDFASHLHRGDPRFAGMVRNGHWDEPHPWFEAIVPFDQAEDTLLRVLDLLPKEIGDGHRFTMLGGHQAPRGFLDPPGVRSCVIGVFPVALSRGALHQLLASIESLNAIVIEAKGRRYLSGWLGSNATEYFRAHFGADHDRWLAARRRCDPTAIFRSSLFPEGNGG